MDQRQILWEFLLELLNDGRHNDQICWSDNFGEFHMVQPNEVARLWGQRKGKEGMTYEKMSRALRQYYGKGIIEKTPGRNFGYYFVRLVELTRIPSANLLKNYDYSMIGSVESVESDDSFSSENHDYGATESMDEPTYNYFVCSETTHTESENDLSMTIDEHITDWNETSAYHDMFIESDSKHQLKPVPVTPLNLKSNTLSLNTPLPVQVTPFQILTNVCGSAFYYGDSFDQ